MEIIVYIIAGLYTILFAAILVFIYRLYRSGILVDKTGCLKELSKRINKGK